jgi:hypothetical protein
MARWSSNIRLHGACLRAIESILEDIVLHPGDEHPDLRYLLDQCPIPQPPKRDDKEFVPAFDLNELETSEA